MIEFTLQHIKTNEKEDQQWKDDVLKVLKQNGLEDAFRGFFSTNDILATYIVASPIKYWLFKRKFGLNVCNVCDGIRFLTGTMEVE